MIDVLTVFGTRPEAIKLAPVVKELERHPQQFISRVCVTAQHREMLDQVLTTFAIVPNYDLNIMQANQALPQLTARLMRSLSDVLHHQPPDVVIVQGDTTSAMVASLASFYHRIPVGHVEAGLRTHDRYSPFPEEINRRIITVVGTYHFAPTWRAQKALLAEGTLPSQVFLTGNTVVDALALTLRAQCNRPVELTSQGKLILVTAHRRENFGKPLENICTAISELVRRNTNVEVVYPVHPNPNIKGPVHERLGGRPRIHLIEPLDYVSFAHLMSRAHIILTDSGGIQEEAPFLGKPVLVMRTETERPEAIEAGTARLVGTASEEILQQTELLLHNHEEYCKLSRSASPFGDGKAAERIVSVLLSKLGSDPPASGGDQLALGHACS